MKKKKAADDPDLFSTLLPEPQAMQVPASPVIVKPHFDGIAFIHNCHCGQWGAFGFNFSSANGELGTWYCARHRPS